MRNLGRNEEKAAVSLCEEDLVQHPSRGRVRPEIEEDDFQETHKDKHPVGLAFVVDPALDAAGTNGGGIDIDERIGGDPPSGIVDLANLPALVGMGNRRANDNTIDGGLQALARRSDGLRIFDAAEFVQVVSP